MFKCLFLRKTLGQESKELAGLNSAWTACFSWDLLNVVVAAIITDAHFTVLRIFKFGKENSSDD